jgi:hypothetical protein
MSRWDGCDLPMVAQPLRELPTLAILFFCFVFCANCHNFLTLPFFQITKNGG